MRRWVCVRAEFESPPEDWSAVHDVFERHGCGGTIEHAAPPWMSGYVFEAPNATAMVASLRRELLSAGAANVVTECVPEEDWAESWKQFFTARQVGETLLILPSWETPPADAEGRAVIHLDPGQAFGTGDHPTTRLCLEYLEQEVAIGDTVLDIGCGSGILSIAAGKLGASELYATEIEQPAALIAASNFERNGVLVNLWQEGGLPDEIPECDVVVSNLVSAILIRLAGSVAHVVGERGKWILSGVIAENFGDVQLAAERAGFTLRERREEEGWIAACFVRQ